MAAQSSEWPNVVAAATIIDIFAERRYVELSAKHCC